MSENCSSVFRAVFPVSRKKIKKQTVIFQPEVSGPLVGNKSIEGECRIIFVFLFLFDNSFFSLVRDTEDLILTAIIVYGNILLLSYQT